MGDNLGRDALLGAMVASRRVELTLARAILDGQNDGTIRRQGKVQTDLPSPNEFAQDLAGHSGQPGLYALADGVTDAEFDTAIRLAYEDRNLSRANVFRKIVRQRIGEEPDMSKSDRPEVLRGTRRLDHNRMANELAITLEGAAQVARLIESSALDADSIEGWVASLSDSLRSLNRFHRQLKETTRAQGT